MNCDDLERLARGGQLESRLGDPDVVVHLRECGACEALYAMPENVGSLLSHQAAQVPELDLDVLRTELHASVERDERSPAAAVRALPTRWRVAIGVLVALGTTAIVASVSARSDWQEYRAPTMWLVLSSFAVLFAVGYRELSRPMFTAEAPNFRRGLAALALALPLGISVVIADSVHAAAHDDAALGVARCLFFGAVFAVPTAIWVFLARRTPWLETPSLVLLAALLGLAGNLVLQVHCSNTAWVHVFFGHAGLGLLLLVPLGMWRRGTETKVF